MTPVWHLLKLNQLTFMVIKVNKEIAMNFTYRFTKYISVEHIL